MPKVSPIQSVFTSGELSGLLAGRVDFEGYKTGLKTCVNQVPIVQGGLLRRPGTYDMAETKFPDRQSVLIGFRYSITDSYWIELGHLYMRFFRNNAPVVHAAQAIAGITQAAVAVVTYVGADTFANGDHVDINGVVGMWQVNGGRYRVANVDTGLNTFELQTIDGANVSSIGWSVYTSSGIIEKVYEIVSPYTDVQVAELAFTQSADALYITHTAHKTRKLTRTGHAAWALASMVNEFAQPETINDGPYLKTNVTPTELTPSGTGGSITITASSIVGINGGAGFKATDVGRLVRLRHGGTWGYALITGFTSTTVVSAFVGEGLGAASATKFWRLGLYSDTTGYPAAVTFFDDRLGFGGCPAAPQRFDLSRTGVYNDFQPTDYDGTVVDDHAVSYTLNSEDVQTIIWMKGEENALLIGTADGEWVARPSKASEAITPTNVTAKQSTRRGSAPVQAIRTGDTVLFVQTAQRQLREMAYVYEADKFKTPDMTVLSEHVTRAATRASSGIVSLAYQRQPHSIVWAVRRDGALLSFTYERDQKVVAWGRNFLGGYANVGRTTPAKVESVACIPSADGTRDEVAFITQRYINGRITRRVEYMTKFWEREDDIAEGVYADSARTYSGAPVTTLTGLHHLVGETVGVLTDGMAHADRVVASDGTITLAWSASVVHVGLRYNSDGETLRMDAGAADGTAQGKVQRTHRMIFRLHDSLGFSYGPSFDKLLDFNFRLANQPVDEPTPLFTGDIEVGWPGSYAADNYACWRFSGMFPGTLLAIMPQMNTQDR